MADITWIKLRTNMFDDEKIKLIERTPEGDSILITWVKLLAYAGKVNCNGYIMINENIPMNVEQVAIIFNRPFEKVKYAISVLQSFGMLDVTEDEIIAISNWEKHQNVEGMDKIRAQNRERKRLERERKKTLLLNNSSVEKSHVTVTGSHDIDIDLDKEKDNNSLSVDKSTDLKELIQFYKTLKNLPQPRSITEKRKTHINARIDEYNLDILKESLNKFNECNMVLKAKEDKKNGKGGTWLDFDWIFNVNNMVKIVEGKYFTSYKKENNIELEDIFG